MKEMTVNMQRNNIGLYEVCIKDKANIVFQAKNLMFDVAIRMIEEVLYGKERE